MLYLLLFFVLANCSQSTQSESTEAIANRNSYEDINLSFENLANMSGKSFADKDSTTNSFRLALTENPLADLENNVPCSKEYEPNSFGKWLYHTSVPWFAEFDLKEMSEDERYITADLKKSLEDSSLSFAEKFEQTDNLWDYFVTKKYISSQGRILVGKENKISFEDFNSQMLALKSVNNYFDNIIDSLINYILITKDNNLETYMQDSSNSLSSLYERAYGAILNIKCLFLAETGGESIKGNADLIDELKKETDLPNSISLTTKQHPSGNSLYALALCNDCEEPSENNSYFAVLFYFQKAQENIEMFFEYIYLTKTSDGLKTKDNRRIRFYTKMNFPKLDIENENLATLIETIAEKKDSDLDYVPVVVEKSAISSILWGDGSDCEYCKGIEEYSISQEKGTLDGNNNLNLESKIGSYYKYINSALTQTNKAPSTDLPSSELKINSQNKCFLIPEDKNGNSNDVKTLLAWHKDIKEVVETSDDYMNTLKTTLETNNLAKCN
jgi:hypothetical protein